jgi:uncharacterized membrane protein
MDKYLIAHLSLGPLLLILGFVFKRFPPKKINYWYGYRTPRSMRSQEAWDCANLYSINALMIVAGLTCLLQLITYTLMEAKASILWSANSMVVGLIGVILLTEFHLKKRGFN